MGAFYIPLTNYYIKKILLLLDKANTQFGNFLEVHTVMSSDCRPMNAGFGA